MYSVRWYFVLVNGGDAYLFVSVGYPCGLKLFDTWLPLVILDGFIQMFQSSSSYDNSYNCVIFHLAQGIDG